MNPRPHRRRFLPVRAPWASLSLLLVLVAAGGCDTMFQQSDDTASSQPGPNAARDARSDAARREVADYLNFLDGLDNTNDQGWHTIFQHTLLAFQEDPTRERHLRLALVMSRADRRSEAPGVTRNMLTDARKLLNDAMHNPDPPPALVRKFIQLQVNDIDRRVALYDEVRSLRSQLARAYQANQTATRDRTEALTRVRRIEAELADANAKLQAVMNIERNIGPTGKETFP